MRLQEFAIGITFASFLALICSGAPQDAAVQVTRESTPSSGLSQELTPDDAPVRITGRLRYFDGSPAANAELKIHGWGANSSRVLRFGEAKAWVDPVTTSAADGTFSFEFAAPRSYQFTLDVTLPGFAAPSWRWGSIEAGTTKDLGDVTLLRGGTIRGHIVDRRGNVVLSDGWKVYGNGPSLVSGDGADTSSVYVHLDHSTSDFVLTDVPPGLVHLCADSDLTSWIQGPTVEVRSGQETRADIVYEGSDLSRRITLSLFSRPFFTFEDEAEEMLLSGPGIETRHATPIPFSSQSHAFDDVPPGTYAVEVKDPKFLPWRRDGVATGSSVSVDLKGNAAIRLQVVDATTGDAIPRYALRVRFDSSNRVPDTFEVHGLDDELPAEGLFDGMLPLDQTLLIEAPGFASCTIPRQSPPANGVVEVSARLTRGTTLEGVIRSADGRPAAEAAVLLLPLQSFEPPDDDGDFTISSNGTMMTGIGRDQFERAKIELEEDLERARLERTDAEGRFIFVGVAPGRYRLRTDDEPSLRASIPEVVVTESAARMSGLALTLPPQGFLVGRLRGPEGGLFTGLRVIAVDPSEGAVERSERIASDLFRDDRDGAVDSEGNFRVGPLPIGSRDVAIEIPAPLSPMSLTDSEWLGEPLTLVLGKATVEAGKDAVVDFDVRKTLPGRVEVTVTMDGRPASNAVVEVVRPPNPDDENEKLNGLVRLAIGMADSHGVATVGPVLVGSHGLVIRAIDRAWAFWPTESVDVSAGALSSAVVAVTLQPGELVAKEKGTGDRIASHHFMVGRRIGDAIDHAIQVKSDERGVLHLCLAPGPYSVFSCESFPDDTVPFDWTERGPVAESIELSTTRDFDEDADDE